MKFTIFQIGMLFLTVWAIVQTVFFDGGSTGTIISILGAMVIWIDFHFQDLKEKVEQK